MLAHTADRQHVRARAFRDRWYEDGGSLVSTDFVMDETLTLLRMRLGLRAAESWWNQVEGSPRIRWEWIDPMRAERARHWFFRWRDKDFSFVKRYPMLVRANPLAQKEGIAGYEIALDFNAVPIQLTPRAASEVKSKQKYQLLSVNAAEQEKNPCRKLVARRGTHWELTPHSMTFLDLLTQ